MAPNVIRSNQMLILNSAMCYVEQRQAISDDEYESTSPRSPPAKRTYVKNISPEEKILRKKLRNREAAQLSRDKKKAQFNLLSGMVHNLRKENLHLREEIESLRSNQEKLMAENERLQEQLATDSFVPKESVSTESYTTEANNRILIDGPEVSHRHPLQKGKQNQISCLMLCCQILFLLLTVPFFMVSNFQMTTTWIGLIVMYQNVYQKSLMNYLAKVFSTNIVLMKWWGAHQKSWNPAKILIFTI
ncbi:X-box-binding protein 1 [Sipha flava]|uniref:X-box-binding protein 1 n=1 Tax=Sipha flava TaxID=143950 RepID=A0A2S2R2Z3_9HEMI|nr:X-box-binding protein 1 [Sipha flava]XP_025410149.1 X-box-binding protein 1 [Sipha flava]